MPLVTGELRDITGSTLASRVGRLKFRLNEPQVVATGSLAGRVLPTAETIVTPGAGGAFEVELTATTTMLGNAFYVLAIEWVDSPGPFVDVPGWQIRVPSGGGSIADFITIGGSNGSSGKNLSLVLLGLSKPSSLAVGQLWWKTDPNNPEGPANTGEIYIGAN